MSYVCTTELDALLARVREDKADTTGKNRNVVAYDCWRMFEDLAMRYKEELEMRDRYKRRADSWRDTALKNAHIQREWYACPCCTGGVIGDRPCTECRGSGLLHVAYDVLRVRYKALLAKVPAENL